MSDLNNVTLGGLSGGVIVFALTQYLKGLLPSTWQAKAAPAISVAVGIAFAVYVVATKMVDLDYSTAIPLGIIMALTGGGVHGIVKASAKVS